jgi:hypothetical protein
MVVTNDIAQPQRPLVRKRTDSLNYEPYAMTSWVVPSGDSRVNEWVCLLTARKGLLQLVRVASSPVPFPLRAIDVTHWNLIVSVR